MQHFFSTMITNESGLTTAEITAKVEESIEGSQVLANGYSVSQLQALASNKVKVFISKDDGIDNSDIESLINAGQENVYILPKGYFFFDLENFLKLGASMIVSAPDRVPPIFLDRYFKAAENRVRINPEGFSKDQILGFLQKTPILFKIAYNFHSNILEEFIKEAKEKVIIIPRGFDVADVNDFISQGATVIISKSDDLNEAVIEKCLTLSGDKKNVKIFPNGFSEEQLEKFKQLGAELVFKVPY